jgi:hypothetical protein
MGQYIQVNGDYNIKTKTGGKVTLNTGPGVGEVRVTGNLVVDGDTLTVSAENLQVQDNLITLNYGETGAGVTLRYSGMEVDRGTENKTAIIYDENDDTWNIGNGTPESGYDYNDSRLRLKEVLTNADTDDGDLTLIGFGTGVVKVLGTDNYRLQVTDPDDIPNKDYVDYAILNNPTYQLRRDDTRVVAFDANDPLIPSLSLSNSIGPYISQPSESLVSILVDDFEVAAFSRSQIRFAGLNFFTEDAAPGAPFGTADAAVIQTTSSSGNIKLETNSTGKVEITYALQLDDNGVTPASVDNATLLYGGTIGTGKTGLYFVNTSTTDELISKRKAFLYSVIF